LDRVILEHLHPSSKSYQHYSLPLRKTFSPPLGLGHKTTDEKTLKSTDLVPVRERIRFPNGG
jgi:hypothetical protein